LHAAPAPEVYLVDGTQLRHVPSPAALAAWRFESAAVVEVDAATIASFSIGPPLPVEPYLLRGTGAAVYVLDVDPASPPPDGIDPGGDDQDDLAVRGACAAAPSGGRAGARLPGALILVLVLVLAHRRLSRGRMA
jgi:hypothetical protein